MSSPWSAQPFVPAGHFDPDAVVEFVPKVGGTFMPPQEPWPSSLYVVCIFHIFHSPPQYNLQSVVQVSSVATFMQRALL